jgi:hypothetical protein
MADITEIQITGDWRIRVKSKDAGYQQRVVALNTEAGTRVLTGLPGYSLDVYGNGQLPWTLKIQHNDGSSGWQDSWIREAPSGGPIPVGLIVRLFESEDITTPDSDRDFDDLIITLEKLGMVAQPSRPHAIHPATLTMMPDGIFEAALGRYFMAVTIQNIWTRGWPASATVGLTARSRQWLLAGGVRVIDSWSAEDQQIFSQQVGADGRVAVGGHEPWETRVVYFKVDVADAAPRKHQVEVDIAEPLSHLNRDARSPMMVSRTTYDRTQGAFVARSDRGRLVAAIRELTVDYNSLKRAVFRARELFGGATPPGGLTPGGADGGRPGCGPKELEELRQRLLAFIRGEDVDFCRLWRDLQCCCAGDGRGRDGMDDGGTWGGRGGTGLEIIALPSVVDYRVEYDPAFTGRFGPLPFDDPWWKVLLAIIAIILSIAAAVSAAADLANKSDDVVIGEVTRTLMDDLVDAAVAELNGNRGLTGAMFSYLDAEAGEANTVPLIALGARIDTAGLTMSNAEIDAAIAAFNDDPTDPEAQAGVRVFKSGARTGLTFGRMQRVGPVNRDDDGDGVGDTLFQNQLFIEEDPAFPNGVSNSGDSGSLWIHVPTLRVVALNHAGSRENNTAMGNRIEDVMNRMGIRFA